jgi:hypothetical protein
LPIDAAATARQRWDRLGDDANVAAVIAPLLASGRPPHRRFQNAMRGGQAAVRECILESSNEAKTEIRDS